MDSMEKIVLIGAGGHAKTIVDTIERLGTYKIVGFISDGKVGEEVYRDYKIIGCDADAEKLYTNGIRHAFLSIGFMGNSKLRNCLYEQYKSVGFSFPVFVDPSAIVASDVIIGEGSYIGKNTVINADARIGEQCIINTSAIIEHECEIGSFSHVAVGATVCGQTVIEDNVLIGANATVIQGLRIGEESIVGAGALVRHNVLKKSKIVGNDRIIN